MILSGSIRDTIFSCTFSCLNTNNYLAQSAIQQVIIELAGKYENIDLEWVKNAKSEYKQKDYKINTSKNDKYT